MIVPALLGLVVGDPLVRFGSAPVAAWAEFEGAEPAAAPPA